MEYIRQTIRIINSLYNAAHRTLFSKHTDMGISSELTSYFFIYLPTQ